MNNYCEKRSVTVLVGEHEKVIAELEKTGIRCVILKNNGDIDFSVRNHADMACYKIDERRIILDRRQSDAAKELENLGCEVILTGKNICGAYPNDVLLNAVNIGGTVICNKKYISREIIESGNRIIDVSQGYTKCSVCPVSDFAFITDDIGIYRKCNEEFDVLLIEKGDILLEGQSYGFIGGASAKIGDTVLFFGSLEYHRDGEKIKTFLKKHNVSYKCLFDGRLIDIGGLIEI